MKARAYACYCTEDVDQTATTRRVCSPSSSQKQRNDLERPRVPRVARHPNITIILRCRRLVGGGGEQMVACGTDPRAE
jgi:hypothetical protein